jgi:hypothetical protein
MDRKGVEGEGRGGGAVLIPVMIFCHYVTDGGAAGPCQMANSVRSRIRSGLQVPGNIRRAEHFVHFLRRFLDHMKRRMEVQAVQQESPRNFLDRLQAEVGIDGQISYHPPPPPPFSQPHTHIPVLTQSRVLRCCILIKPSRTNRSLDVAVIASFEASDACHASYLLLNADSIYIHSWDFMGFGYLLIKPDRQFSRPPV